MLAFATSYVAICYWHKSGFLIFHHNFMFYLKAETNELQIIWLLKRSKFKRLNGLYLNM